MTRKGVLLRFRPEVLARVDQVRGAQNRTEWLMAVILRELDALDAPPKPPESPLVAGAGLLERTEFGGDL